MKVVDLGKILSREEFHKAISSKKRKQKANLIVTSLLLAAVLLTAVSSQKSTGAW